MFTSHPPVVHLLNDVKRYWRRSRKEVSDIIDDEGNQYVDLVMEGRGVLGIALLGYTYVLESLGIRFLGIGGTSAGAISAAMLSGLGTPAEAKSKRSLALLAELDMYSFVNGDDDAKDLIDTWIGDSKGFKLAWKAVQVIGNFREDLGLNPGEVFRSWVAQALRGAGVKTAADLAVRLKTLPPGLRTRQGKPLSVKEAAAQLKLVAADVSTKTKAVFPEMADLYYPNPARVSPADFVRASMSVPGFFHPFRIRPIPKGKDAARRWKDKAGYTGTLPSEAVFVDGGIMSNFPIDLFHQKGVPTAPTFGAKLGVDRTQPEGLQGPLAFLGAIFNAARHRADYDFILRNPDFKQLVAVIETGPHFWLDFKLYPEAKVDLFARGASAATTFLRAFDWGRYKATRQEMQRS